MNDDPLFLDRQITELREYLRGQGISEKTISIINRNLVINRWVVSAILDQYKPASFINFFLEFACDIDDANLDKKS